MGLTCCSKLSVGCSRPCGLCCLLPMTLKLAVSAGKWGGLRGVPAVRQTESASAEHFSHLLLGPLVWTSGQEQVRSLALAFCGAPSGEIARISYILHELVSSHWLFSLPRDIT